MARNQGVKSREVVAAAVAMALTVSREEERRKQEAYHAEGLVVCAVDVGGNMVTMLPKIMESTLVAAKRNGLVGESHASDGAVIGALRDALDQVVQKAVGFNAGGKVGIARGGEHLSVCVFLSIGLLHLDDVVIGMGHRVIV